MAVYEINFDPDAYQPLRFLHPEKVMSSAEWQEWFAGKPMHSEWKDIAVEFEVIPGKRFGDFPSLGGIPPVFSARAVEVLQAVIRDNVEYLSLLCSSAQLYAVNVIKVLDCLDTTKSRVKRFSDGRVMRIEEYVFRDECIGGNHIFKIPEQIRNRIYVSKKFKMAVESHHLQGMLFHRVA